MTVPAARTAPADPADPADPPVDDAATGPLAPGDRVLRAELRAARTRRERGRLALLQRLHRT